jgi:hypothetical protein
MTVPAVLLTAANHYLSRGLSKPAACGIPLVLYYGESQLQTGNQPGTAHTDTGGVLWPNAGGIASWNGPRQALLKAFCDRHKLAYTDLTAQLDFVLAEIWNPPGYPSVKAAIQSATTTVQQMITVFVENYERPAAPGPEITRAESGISELMADPGLGMTVPPVIVLPTPPPAVPAPLPSLPTAPSPGVNLMDPATLAALAPVFEAIAAGILRVILAQLTPGVVVGAAVGTVAPTTMVAPPINLASLATELVPLLGNALVPSLTSQLTSSLPGLIASEMARIAPTPTPGTKP